MLLKMNLMQLIMRRELALPSCPSSGFDHQFMDKPFPTCETLNVWKNPDDSDVNYLTSAFVLSSLITVAFYFFVKNAHWTIRVFAKEVMEKVGFCKGRKRFLMAAFFS